MERIAWFVNKFKEDIESNIRKKRLISDMDIGKLSACETILDYIERVEEARKEIESEYDKL